MEIPIIDLEVDNAQGEPEQVATLRDNGEIEAEDSMVEEDLETILGPNRAAPYRHTSTEDEGEEEPAIVEELTMIEPGEPGYLAIAGEVLTYPYEVNWSEVDMESLSEPQIGEQEDEE